MKKLLTTILGIILLSGVLTPVYPEFSIGFTIKGRLETIKKDGEEEETRCACYSSENTCKCWIGIIIDIKLPWFDSFRQLPSYIDEDDTYMYFSASLTPDGQYDISQPGEYRVALEKSWILEMEQNYQNGSDE